MSTDLPAPRNMQEKLLEEDVAKAIYKARIQHRSHGPQPHHLIYENYVARFLLAEFKMEPKT